MATWELFRNGTKEPDLIDVQYIDSANPFGDRVTAQIEDNQGAKFDTFEYAQEIEITVTPDGGSQISKFTGFVVERRENDQNGQDVLEIVAYSFDQFLRQSDVTNDQTGNLISEAIEDIIKTDTPVSFNPSKVNVIDDFELRRSLQDERVETALQILSFTSGNEGFGVDDALDFFFRQREQTNISRGIDATQWFDYDIPERGKEAINEVEVRFDNGNRSVIIDNPSQKLDIQNSLNLPDPATQRVRIARPDINNAQDAEDEGRRFLKLKNVTLTGEVSTFQLFDAEPFDTIQISIPSRGINSEFIITQIEYNWSDDSTTLSIVENRGFDDDLLVRLAEKTERVDLRQTDPKAVEDRIISADVAASIESTVDVGPTVDAQTTNTAVDLIVSGWGGDGNISVSEIVLGDGTDPASRSDTDLQNQIASASVTESLPTSTSVQYVATFNLLTVQEIGLKDGAGNLLCRGVLDSPVQTTQAGISFEISDATEQNGVVTATGQTSIRDIIADNNPQIPTRYELGSSQTTPQESDTSLNALTDGVKLNRTLLQQIGTESGFRSAIPPIPDDSPLIIDLGGVVTTAPVTYAIEAENADFAGDLFQSVATLSDDEGINIDNAGNFVEFTFQLNQDVPPNQLRVGVYAELRSFRGRIDFFFDNEQYGTDVFQNAVSGQNLPRGVLAGVNDTLLRGGTEHTLRVETNGVASGDYIIDALFAFDRRSKFNINSAAQSSFKNGSYETPELFPDNTSVSFEQLNSRRLLTELELFQSWNDTTNNTSVTLNLGSQSTTINNPTRNSNGNIRETLSVSQSDAAREGSIDITLSRGDDFTSDTIPNAGNVRQEMSFHNVDGNPTAVNRSDIGEATTRAFFRADNVSGNILRESGQLAGGDLLTHSIFADVQSGNDTIIPVETIRFIPE